MIRLAEYDDLETISLLMLDLFHVKMSGAYTKEGRVSFLKQIETDALAQRFLQESLFYIYEIDGYIEGVIELEKSSHIAFLFSRVEKKGIARALCQEALNHCGVEVCTVGAFSEAIGFYKHLGFVILAEAKIAHGIEFTLMASKTNSITRSNLDH
ncbi:GNAT family N-acetyltransferase [Sulfurimonas sp. MAG313]|nr:GNAT family N-acetyltransferase [Sulfurimonas sp. MAG313]MDF1880231.1 GNAT family N-acetyltransferase [Sulfurimonas sp. MAG313]